MKAPISTHPKTIPKPSQQTNSQPKHSPQTVTKTAKYNCRCRETHSLSRQQSRWTSQKWPLSALIYIMIIYWTIRWPTSRRRLLRWPRTIATPNRIMHRIHSQTTDTRVVKMETHGTMSAWLRLSICRLQIKCHLRICHHRSWTRESIVRLIRKKREEQRKVVHRFKNQSKRFHLKMKTPWICVVIQQRSKVSIRVWCKSKSFNQVV